MRFAAIDEIHVITRAAESTGFDQLRLQLFKSDSDSTPTLAYVPFGCLGSIHAWSDKKYHKVSKVYLLLS